CWPKSLDTLFGGAQTVCDRVSEMTGGGFTITPYAAGEIVPGLQVMDAVESGTVECGHSASYYYIGKNPALAFGTSVPFGLTAQQQNAWLYHGGGLEAMNEIYADFNMISFPAGNTGAQMGGWFKRAIETVADLKGLKMRIPGLGGQVMAKLGVNVQVLPGGEVYLALERGAIDAAEWAGPYDDEKLGLYKAAQYYYYPGWWEPGPTLFAQVNLNAWDRLPSEYREIFKTAAYEANLNMLAKYDALNAEALARLIAKGTEVRPYSLEILQAAQKAAFEIYEENASQDAGFKEVYQQWKDFRRLVFNWNEVNEYSFAKFAFGSTPRG
ncbi:MAG: TRAP transporter substrate-binding protein, partial [Okeania sp. SIO2H7]|nr:TRAP transporter substrate-binding protein [Okeania sp. SIO2H7]